MSESIHDSYTRNYGEDDFNPTEEDKVRCEFCNHIAPVEEMEFTLAGFVCPEHYKRIEFIKQFGTD